MRFHLPTNNNRISKGLNKKSAKSYNYPRRESRLEINFTVQTLDVFFAQADVQRFQIGQKMLDLAPPDDREDINSLLQEISNGN